MLAHQALENSTEGVFITTPDLKVLYVNKAYCEITGHDASLLINNPITGVFDEGYTGDFVHDLWASLASQGSFKKEFNNHRQDGELYRQLTSISAMRDEDGEIFKLIGTITDVTQVRDYEAKLDFLAFHNETSGLPNRRLLEKCFQEKRESTNNPNHVQAVIFFDLDNFKLINDTLGHSVGDELIKEIGERAQDALRNSDIVAHLSGDEFAAIVSVKCREGAMQAANKLMDAFQEPFLSPHNQTHISVSIGVALCPDDADNLEALLQCADQAMYSSKRQGRNTINFYCAEDDQKGSNSLNVLNALHSAIHNDEFKIAYQPVMNLQSGLVESVEALIRWPNAQFGYTSPEIFIPLAEKFGLICQISDWVLEKACLQGVEWRKNQIFDGRIAVNLCARELRLPNIVERITGVLEKTGLPPEALALEITEGTMVSAPDKVGSVLQTFRNMGISIYIDDFGTGYSSLSYLPQLPANVLKIDKSFIEGLYQEEKNVVIATTILQMAQNLGMAVIAEGVETASQMQFLRKKGCSHAQGYYFGEPMLPAAFQDFACQIKSTMDLSDRTDYTA
nr:GGDEF domain-containing phosphodiesterase [Litorivivens lipolytica]